MQVDGGHHSSIARRLLRAGCAEVRLLEDNKILKVQGREGRQGGIRWRLPEIRSSFK